MENSIKYLDIKITQQRAEDELIVQYNILM